MSLNSVPPGSAAPMRHHYCNGCFHSRTEPDGTAYCYYKGERSGESGKPMGVLAITVVLECNFQGWRKLNADSAVGSD